MMMDELFYLARSASSQAVLSNIGILGLRLLVVSLGLYLAGQAIINIPYLQSHMQQVYGRLVLFIILTLSSLLIILWIPDLRILSETGLGQKGKWRIWFDIIFTTLVMVRLSYLWPSIFAWFNRQSQ